MFITQIDFTKIARLLVGFFEVRIAVFIEDYKHLNFRCGYDIYHFNLMFVCFAKSEIFTSGVKNPQNGYLFGETLSEELCLELPCVSATKNLSIKQVVIRELQFIGFKPATYLSGTVQGNCDFCN